ncbi:MAG: hypothetical protein LBN31_07625 [Hungatella sp.]|nr:hypothetical protein [Hungatella sp.]
MTDVMFKGKETCDKWVRGYYFTKVLNHTGGEKKQHHYIFDLLGRTWNVKEESISYRVPNVAWYWEYDDGSENIEEVWINDIVEFHLKDHTKHIGYLTSEYGCLAIISKTLPDGFIWIHEIEDDSCGELVEDVDGVRYVTAKLLGNLYDNKEMLDN